jgi:hypothetical protein
MPIFSALIDLKLQPLQLINNLGRVTFCPRQRQVLYLTSRNLPTNNSLDRLERQSTALVDLAAQVSQG